ncbi:N-acetyl-gamma-glutamyl-phosphate reductase [Thalassotalea aquiviva]|uniref:N-acetyl-gamma-glutamyl-phosphate reductase n=1 Tax=Thalassotalea aquiviva TaxID=3242415 RepID=UPI00352A6EDA
MKVAIIGASGYAGAELASLLHSHQHVSELTLFVSEQSQDIGKELSELYPKLHALENHRLHAFSKPCFSQIVTELDAVFFATPHEFSHLWADKFLQFGVKVFDLSGAFRLKHAAQYPQHYQFEHQSPNLLPKAVYGLVEWLEQDLTTTDLIAVPGCYPTASLLSIKPLSSAHLLKANSMIVVNGISGVSGAGRKASLSTSFNEVSLTAYNILQHRHQPEISQECGYDVVFNPHLAPFKRGLLCTLTMQLKQGVSQEQVQQAFSQAYANTPCVRLVKHWPKVDDVVGTPYAHLYFHYQADIGVIVVSCAIDNLLKGAASQALQCFNSACGFSDNQTLIEVQG